jgi:glycosyltransferase involved in cell wall biosynthesis
MKLSLCLAVYNEIANIHIPLDSAIGFVDEVVVVDGGSDDGTVEKLKSYGEKVRVYTEPNPTMFHINKQKALEYATGDWIIQLDADEALSPELIEEINVIVSNEYSLNAYWIPRKNWFLNRFLMKGGQYPDYTIRLYRRGKARFPCKSVHEQVEVEEGDTKVGKLTQAILHYADPTFDRYLSRWNRYTTLDAEDLAKRKGKLTWIDAIEYFVFRPIHWFFWTYLRHRGYVDGFAGFVFSLFSALRFWAIYIKAWAKLNAGKGA